MLDVKKLMTKIINAFAVKETTPTVPDGYRPVSEHGAPFDGSSVFWFVSADGSLKVNATGANTFWGAMTYVGGVLHNLFTVNSYKGVAVC